MSKPWWIEANDGVVHRLDPDRRDHALCGLDMNENWQSEPDKLEPGARQCGTCSNVVGRRKAAVRRSRRPSQAPAVPVPWRRPKLRVVRFRRGGTQQEQDGRKGVEALAADRGQQERSTSIRTVSGGLPTLGRGHR